MFGTASRQQETDCTKVPFKTSITLLNHLKFTEQTHYNWTVTYEHL